MQATCSAKENRAPNGLGGCPPARLEGLLTQLDVHLTSLRKKDKSTMVTKKDDGPLRDALTTALKERDDLRFRNSALEADRAALTSQVCVWLHTRRDAS